MYGPANDEVKPVNDTALFQVDMEEIKWILFKLVRNGDISMFCRREVPVCMTLTVNLAGHDLPILS